jgi:hypothetical protein
VCLCAVQRQNLATLGLNKRQREVGFEPRTPSCIFPINFFTPESLVSFCTCDRILLILAEHTCPGFACVLLCFLQERDGRNRASFAYKMKIMLSFFQVCTPTSFVLILEHGPLCWDLSSLGLVHALPTPLAIHQLPSSQPWSGLLLPAQIVTNLAFVVDIPW